MKRKGYLVLYSTGQYEDFREHAVKLFISKERAEKYAKKIDAQHRSKKSMFMPDRDEDGNYIESEKTWSSIQYQIDEYEEENPFLLECPSYKNDPKGYAEYLKKYDEYHEKLIIKFVSMHYPEWDEAMIKKAVSIEEYNDRIYYEDYGDAYIEEIEIDLNEN